MKTNIGRLTIVSYVIFFGSLQVLLANDKHHKEYSETYQIDSVSNFLFDSENNAWVPSTVRIYEYGQYLLPATITTVDFTTRENISRLSYWIGDDELIEGHQVDMWQNGDWQPFQYATILYDENNFRTGLNIFSYYTGSWEPLQQATYITDEEGKILQETRQYLDSEGNWYDFSEYHFYYNEYGNIDHRLRIELKNNDTIYQESYVYDSDQQPIRLYKKRMQYNKETGRYDIPIISFNKFVYNDLSQLFYVVSMQLIDGEWVRTGRSVYHYSLTQSKKVAICHNGHTIYVSRNAVPAHLRHGDHLGECPDEVHHKKGKKKSYQKHFKSQNNLKSDSSLPLTENQDIMIYPNPAHKQFTIDLGTHEKNISQIEIFDLSGRIIQSFPVNGNRIIQSNNELPGKGIYIVRFPGTEVISKKLIVE